MRNGKLGESALKRSVLKKISKSAGVGADCALFTIPNGQILAWCAKEAAVAVWADTAEVKLLFQKAANNLATAGAKAVSAQVTIMLPAGSDETTVRELMAQAAEACETLELEITGGDTNVSFTVTKPVLSVTLLGYVSSEKCRSISMAKAGQDIILSKWIGLEGTALLARTFREKLLQRYPAYLVDEASEFDRYFSVVPEALIALENGVAAMHDMSMGGVLGGLWELAEGAGLGLAVDLKKIPIRQETVEVCEVCGINPYEMRSGGSMIMTSQDGEALAEALRRNGIPAAVIGKLTDGSDRILRNEEEIRYLDRPRGTDVILECLKAYCCEEKE